MAVALAADQVTPRSAWRRARHAASACPIGVEAGPDEGPDLLGDGAPVRGGGQLAEYRKQAQVDALEDHVGLRDADVLGDRAAQVEEATRDRGGVFAGDRQRPRFADGVVEDSQVLDDRLRC